MKKILKPGFLKVGVITKANGLFFNTYPKFLANPNNKPASMWVVVLDILIKMDPCGTTRIYAPSDKPFEDVIAGGHMPRFWVLSHDGELYKPEQPNDREVFELSPYDLTRFNFFKVVKTNQPEVLAAIKNKKLRIN